MSRTESSLWRELDDLRPLGDVDDALARGREIESGGRRRLRWLAVVAAAVAVVAVVGVSAWWSPEQLAAPAGDVGPPDAAPAIEISERIAEWVPGSSAGGLAPVGTALARQCQETCRHLLVRADGGTIPVARVSPDLAEMLGDADPGDVSLSFDARWLAIADGGSLRLYSLEPGTSVPVVFAPGEPSYRWQLVGWGRSRTSAALAEYDAEGGPVRYGHADLLDSTVHTVAAPEPGRFGPVGSSGLGVQVSDRGREGAPLTAVRLVNVPVVQNERQEVGVVSPLIGKESGDEPLDVATALGPGETLAGPGGFAEVADPPSPTFAKVPQQVTVFARGSDGPERAGLIALAGDGPERLEYAEVEGWQLLGAIRPDEAALTTDRDGRSLVKGHSAAGIEWQHELRGDVTWYLPGLRP